MTQDPSHIEISHTKRYVTDVVVIDVGKIETVDPLANNASEVCNIVISGALQNTDEYPSF